ncbi:hypothetical protein [Ruminococcus sp.]|uniref:hypothetical protein n=1 Tax=Ruminococcus sp. TaxID=41978 RepID=UPI0025F464A0|nr:hypothetical protein [Ruminococcus sp.]
MKRKIIVAVIAAAVFAVMVLVMNITPNVEVGSVVLTCGGDKYELPGTQTQRYYRGKSDKLGKEPELETLLKEAPSFDVEAALDKDGKLVLKTPMTVSVSGKITGDILYTVYDYEGNVLSKAQKKLSLPDDNMNGCIVRAAVKWGKDGNYLEEVYYFAAMYDIKR